MTHTMTLAERLRLRLMDGNPVNNKKLVSEVAELEADLEREEKSAEALRLECVWQHARIQALEAALRWSTSNDYTLALEYHVGYCKSDGVRFTDCDCPNQARAALQVQP